MGYPLIFTVPLALIVFFVLLEPLRWAFTNTRVGMGASVGPRSASATLTPSVIIAALVAVLVAAPFAIGIVPVFSPAFTVPLAIIIFAVLVYALLGAFSMTMIGAGRAGPRSSGAVWATAIVVAAIVAAAVAYLISGLV